MSMKKLLALANRFGIYTRGQYLEAMGEKGRIADYVKELEAAVNGMSDPKRTIVVMADHALVKDVELVHGQQLIISPRARHVVVSGLRIKGAA